ncbi:MAG: GntR family transcriptional regulator [Pseudomonadota bacterium]
MADHSAVTPVRSASVVELVLQQLEGLFTTSAFAPGERLNELDLARRMAVSRASLREAARKLEQRGWLVARPNRGFFVRSFNEAEVRDIYEARFCIESFGLRKALSAGTAPDLPAVEAAFTLLEEAIDAADQIYIDRLLAFHRAIAALAGNARLLQSFDHLALDTKLMISLIGGVQSSRDDFVERNRRVLEALQCGSQGAAIAELNGYLAQGLEEAVSFLSGPDTPC